MYSAPTPQFDINRKDFVHPGYANPFNGFNTGSGGPFYPQQQQSFDEMSAPLFPIPDGVSFHQPPDGGLPSIFQPNGFNFGGGLAPAFQYNSVQVPSPLLRTPSSSSQSSLSFEATLRPSPGPSFGNVPQLYPEPERKLPKPRGIGRARKSPSKRPRKRGPNKRPANTGYSYLLEKLPEHVREALNMTDPDCCGGGEKDSSTTQKHMFSNKHVKRFCTGMEHMLPSFVCPAFVALHDKCGNAKAGRYDSAERHCKNCPGFADIQSKHEVFPVEVTNGEYDAIVLYRADKNPSAETIRLVVNPVDRLLKMLLNAGMSLELKSDVSDAMDATAAEQPSPLGAESADEYSQDHMLYF